MWITKYTMKNKMSLIVTLMLEESTLNSMLDTHMDVSSIIDLLSYKRTDKFSLKGEILDLLFIYLDRLMPRKVSELDKI